MLTFYGFDLFHIELVDNTPFGDEDYSSLGMPFDRSKMFMGAYYPDEQGQYVISKTEEYELREAYQRGMPLASLVEGDIDAFKHCVSATSDLERVHAFFMQGGIEQYILSFFSPNKQM